MRYHCATRSRSSWEHGVCRTLMACVDEELFFVWAAMAAKGGEDGAKAERLHWTLLQKFRGFKFGFLYGNSADDLREVLPSLTPNVRAARSGRTEKHPLFDLR